MNRSLVAACLTVVTAVTALAPAAPAAGQIRNVQAPPQNWFGVSAGRYLDMGRVQDGNSEWIFGEAFLLGVEYHRQVGPGLLVGATVTGAMPNYESRTAGLPLVSGRATLLAPMLTGRLNTGGAGGGVAFYLTGGGGAFIYRLPELDRWDPDLAFYTGAGLDYAPGGGGAFFLEWGRFWVYHEGDGIQSNRALHSLIRLGARFGR